MERKPRKKGTRERVVVVEVHPNVVSTDPPSAWRTEQERVADSTSTQRTHSYRLPTEGWCIHLFCMSLVFCMYLVSVLFGSVPHV